MQPDAAEGSSPALKKEKNLAPFTSILNENDVIIDECYVYCWGRGADNRYAREEFFFIFRRPASNGWIALALPVAQIEPRQRKLSFF
jgi:hypothetical protein